MQLKESPEQFQLIQLFSDSEKDSQSDSDLDDDDDDFLNLDSLDNHMLQGHGEVQLDLG
jgi:hypothetical protein